MSKNPRSLLSAIHVQGGTTRNTFPSLPFENTARKNGGRAGGVRMRKEVRSFSVAPKRSQPVCSHWKPMLSCDAVLFTAAGRASAKPWQRGIDPRTELTPIAVSCSVSNQHVISDRPIIADSGGSRDCFVYKQASVFMRLCGRVKTSGIRKHV